MSAYPPPSQILPIFNPLDFNFENFPLTINDAKNYFVEYPVAQGTETLLTTIVNGASTFNDISTHNDLVEISQPTAALNALNIENDTPGQSLTATSFTAALTSGLLTAQGSAVINETNPITEAGDSVISSSIFGADDTGSLTLTQKSTAVGSGIRLNSGMVKIYGDLDLQTGTEINFPDGSIQNTAFVSSATETLAQTLLQGNSAGATDIDMNGQDILNAGTINYTALNPPVGGAETLAQTLVLGNSAGATDLDMNSQDILNATNITTGTLNYTTLNPPIVPGAGGLAATLLVGSSAGATSINMNAQNISNCNELQYITLNPPIVPGGTLAQTLLLGNSAGATDLDMNTQDILNAGTINYTTLNPPVPGSETLAQTLTTGNSAGTTDIDMNSQNITNALAITTGTLNYTTLNPPIVPGGSETLAQTLVLGNSAGATDLDMNTQDILNATNITTGTLNYTTLNPPVSGGTNTLAQTLTLGNSAGANDIDMNSQDITNAVNITTQTLNYTTLNPAIPPPGSLTLTNQPVYSTSFPIGSSIAVVQPQILVVNSAGMYMINATFHFQVPAAAGITNDGLTIVMSSPQLVSAGNLTATSQMTTGNGATGAQYLRTLNISEIVDITAGGLTFPLWISAAAFVYNTSHAINMGGKSSGIKLT